MSYLEQIKKLSTYSNLPNFAILSNNKLYLPNSDNQYTILGKWSLDWIHSNRCAIGTVEQDPYNNITFQITSCYECTDGNTTFELIPKDIYTEFWNRVYHHDPLLSYIHINISEFYQSSPIVSLKSTKSPIIQITEPTKEPIKGLIEVTGGSHIGAKTVYESPKHQIREKTISPKYQPQPKEKIIDTVIIPKEVKEQTGKSCLTEQVTLSGKSCLTEQVTLSGDKFQVCKTDKPDVYHVYQSNKYVSTCLISNMKTSLHMQNVFEHKQISEMVTMNMKLHVNTNKYYPII